MYDALPPFVLSDKMIKWMDQPVNPLTSDILKMCNCKDRMSRTSDSNFIHSVPIIFASGLSIHILWIHIGQLHWIK